MIFLERSGVFLVKNSESRERLKKTFGKNFYKKGNNYYIKGSDRNYEKLLRYFGDLLNWSCYLYPLLKELKRRNLKQKTRNLYFYLNKRFLEFVQKQPEDVDLEDIRAFLNYLRKEGKQENTLSTVLNALKFCYEDILEEGTFHNICVRKRKYIPKVFSRKEIYLLLRNVKNPKHKLLLEMAYCCGLKLNEIRKIKISDINLGEGKLYIRGSEYKIVRTVPIPDTLTRHIKSYITGYYRDKDGYSEYLFFSESKRNRLGKITERTVEEIFQKALTRSGIKGHFTFSALRDSFVVHLLELNIPEQEVIKLLGIKKAQFYNRYAFFIKAVNIVRFPDLLDFRDIKVKNHFGLS